MIDRDDQDGMKTHRPTAQRLGPDRGEGPCRAGDARHCDLLGVPKIRTEFVAFLAISATTLGRRVRRWVSRLLYMISSITITP